MHLSEVERYIVESALGLFLLLNMNPAVLTSNMFVANFSGVAWDMLAWSFRRLGDGYLQAHHPSAQQSVVDSRGGVRYGQILTTIVSNYRFSDVIRRC